jgi:predicted lysophospholipase L1 biosynthesis ABC-type transport system permease subunit
MPTDFWEELFLQAIAPVEFPATSGWPAFQPLAAVLLCARIGNEMPLGILR